MITNGELSIEGPATEPMFYLDGFGWASVEHYYHAQKILDPRMEITGINAQKYAKSFSWESGSSLSRTCGGKVKIAGKGGMSKAGITITNIREWDTKVSTEAMFKAVYSRFLQNKASLDILMNTHSAKLLHAVTSRGNPTTLVELPHTLVRDILKSTRKLDRNDIPDSMWENKKVLSGFLRKKYSPKYPFRSDFCDLLRAIRIPL